MKKHKRLVMIGLIAGMGLIAIAILGARSGDASTEISTGGVLPGPDVIVRAYPSYAHDIQPIFADYCVGCHGSANAPNGLHLDSFEGVMKGTNFGAVVVAGKPGMSPLLALLRHESDPKIWMPFHGERLSSNRIQNIENWIRYGARNN